MRYLVVLLGLATAAQAGEISPTVELRLSQEQAHMIVNTLNQVSCPNVAALKTCNEVAAIVETIVQQTRAQLEKK